MNQRIQIIVGVSYHLPNGTREDTFEALYKGQIKPLVMTLNKFPMIRMVFHYSGLLLHWIERRHPELIMLMEDLLGRKQAELLGGGFYEPLLPMLPQSDKLGQIEMLTTYLRKQFGKRPQGCWVPALAWEQNLVGPLSACGMSYTFLDDTCFVYAKAKQGKSGFYDPCLTEDLGKLITIFPISTWLSNDFFGNSSSDALEKVYKAYHGIKDDSSGPIVVFPEFKTTEKSEPVYHSFFEELSNKVPRFEFTLPGRIYKNLKGQEKLYFCGISRDSEGVCASPRQFLVDYPEANTIYAKTMHTHTLINQLRGDKARKTAAREELWKAQDSGIYRDGGETGRFYYDTHLPGISSFSIRKAAYRALIQAEKITREKKKGSPALLVFDFDLDGEGEYLFEGENFNCYIKARGASIIELDYLPSEWNYLDVFQCPGKSERRCRGFADFLLPAIPEKAAFLQTQGRFCGDETFEAVEIDRVRKKVVFKLPPQKGIPLGRIEIVKTWQIKEDALEVHYLFKNAGGKQENFVFIPHAALSFPGEGEAFVRTLALRNGVKEPVSPAPGEILKDISLFEYRDIKNESHITFEGSRAFDLRIFPVRSSSKSGLSEYQFTLTEPVLPVSLGPNESWGINFTLKITS